MGCGCRVSAVWVPLMLFVHSVLVAPGTAALPILRAPRPRGAPTTLAAARFGVDERALFPAQIPPPFNAAEGKGGKGGREGGRTNPLTSLWRHAMGARRAGDGLRVTQLAHSLEGEGFHRTVHIRAEVSWRGALAPVMAYPGWAGSERVEGSPAGESARVRCQLAVVLLLPSTLYADRFELEGEMLRRNRRDGRGGAAAAGHAQRSAEVFEDAFLIGEKAAPDCNASVLAVTVGRPSHLPVSPTLTLSSEP
jgi:hypothetical protein